MRKRNINYKLYYYVYFWKTLSHKSMTYSFIMQENFMNFQNQPPENLEKP